MINTSAHSFKQINLLCYIALFFIACSCSNPDDVVAKEKSVQDSATSQLFNQNSGLKNYSEINENKGFIGIFDVPEMLTLCVKDSAAMNDLAKKYAQAFTTLEEELKSLNIKSSGAPGAINYNNDPANFIFECVYPIEKMPKTQPKKSLIVVLEKSNMLIYNYYGEYTYLYKAYEEILKIMKEINVTQNGAMREFYITDPTREKDSTKWLTRIMVPVMPK